MYRVLYCLSVIVVSMRFAAAGENVIKNGDFADGVNGWSDLANDNDRTAVVADVDGKKALVLTRKTPKAAAGATQYNLKLKHETLYHLSVEYKGDAAAMTFKPAASTDPKFAEVSKSWATSCCPLPASKEWRTETLVFDAGELPDNAFVAVRLDGEAPGSCAFRTIALTSVGSSAPDKSETVILHIGDSITITSYLPFTERVNALLDARIVKEFPALKVRNLNVGADGEYIKDLLDSKRYDKVIHENLKKVDIAVIRYGGNDSRFYPADEFKKLIGTLCDNLQRDYPGIQIVLGTGTFVSGHPELQKQYGAYWQAHRDVAAERKIPLADVEKRLETENSDKTAKSPGDMHPSAYGVQLIAETEFEALKPLLAGRK